MKRGVKRKYGDENDDDTGSSFYSRNLSNFQTLARKRESLRLKHNVIVSGNDAAAALEKQLKARVAVEMSLMEGTAKFIMACRNQSQVIGDNTFHCDACS